MKKILGLDLGTNSIGWALVEQDFDKKLGQILGLGTRVIPMSQEILGEFDRGNSISQTADRTRLRSARRIRERHLLRRERLHRILNILGFLPEHYAEQINFTNHPGKFHNESEPKIAYREKYFIFKESFTEMLEDFKKHQSHILVKNNGNAALVPYDWTLYYLRKKALTKKIEKEELAWILLNFNQKRGYYQLRGEEQEDNQNKLVEFHSLRIVEVAADESQKARGDAWYSLSLENGWVYRRSSKTPLFDWKNKTRDFIVTTELNEDGSIKKDKDGNEKRSFRAPGEDDWTLLKKKTEHEIGTSQKTVGEYIYDSLLQNAKVKIKGKLIRTIERTYYKEELRKILQKQVEVHPELRNQDLFNECIRELYRNNEAHQTLLGTKDFQHLFIDDVIFFQRPLRSQKSSIANCGLESRLYKDENGIKHTQFLKAIPKSNPYYQEFRLWQWIYNLSIYNIDNDENVTQQFLSNVESYEKLYEYLNDKKEIEQKSLIRYLLESNGLKGKKLTAEIERYRWNYVEDKKYPANETRTIIKIRLAKVNGVPDKFLTRDIEYHLWHIIYSVRDKIEYEKALKSFARRHQINDTVFYETFKSFPPFTSDYGSYSEKAIKKLLPLMRLGKFWSWEEIHSTTKARINKIISGEYDENIKTKVRDKALHLQSQTDFQGLQLWLAQYIVYDRHSEAANAGKWNSPDDIKKYLNNFKQHSLRNPIVEQVVTETLRVVHDIWSIYGNSKQNFIDEIHIELGRSMKNSAAERKQISNQISENENTNLRLKALLMELKNDAAAENVRPYSPMQQEILKVYEEGVLNSEIEIEPDILKISKSAQPSSSELKRYKLWLEQKYRSPYTGEIIPLNKLFTPDYEIEHIIPQSLYFDDSLSNKVICEAAVNKIKDNQLAYEFIKNHHGQKIPIGHKTVQIFELTEFEDFVKKHYLKNRSKRNKLLMEEIPDKMIERQLNDTRYISKHVSALLSNVVRSETNDDGINSKHLIPGNGRITNELKQDWGLNNVWNELILPRFERLNGITNSNLFTAWNEKNQNFLPAVPLEHSKGFSKKRIDHRHHALDALVIACATRDHINLLNNKHAKSKERFDLSRKLRKFERVVYNHPKTGERIERDIPAFFLKPWQNFTVDAKKAMSSIIVSFKQNLRIINKATNYYESWVENSERKVKELQGQKGTNWAIRKPLHKDTVSGKVYLQSEAREVPVRKAIEIVLSTKDINLIVDPSFRKAIQTLLINLQADVKAILSDPALKDLKKIKLYDIKSATRQNNDLVSVFKNVTSKDKAVEIIKKITDTGIQKILLSHLKAKGNDAELAFSPEGIEDMNNNLKHLNDGRDHQPIFKVRLYESFGNKFAVGEKGNKSSKFVEAAKGTNLFFGIYQDVNGKRTYETIPLNIVIERQKQGLSPVPEKNESGHSLLFHLSPNDLVYVPTPEEKENMEAVFSKELTNEQIKRIYKMVSCTGGECHFVPASYSSPILNNECGTNNKNERVISFFKSDDLLEEDNKGILKPVMIKNWCVKLMVDRIGRISDSFPKGIQTS